MSPLTRRAFLGSLAALPFIGRFFPQPQPEMVGHVVPLGDITETVIDGYARVDTGHVLMLADDGKGGRELIRVPVFGGPL